MGSAVSGRSGEYAEGLRRLGSGKYLGDVDAVAEPAELVSHEARAARVPAPHVREQDYRRGGRGAGLRSPRPTRSPAHSHPGSIP